jgi:hypothetical protein
LTEKKAYFWFHLRPVVALDRPVRKVRPAIPVVHKAPKVQMEPTVRKDLLARLAPRVHKVSRDQAGLAVEVCRPAAQLGKSL